MTKINSVREPKRFVPDTHKSKLKTRKILMLSMIQMHLDCAEILASSLNITTDKRTFEARCTVNKQNKTNFIAEVAALRKVRASLHFPAGRKVPGICTVPQTFPALQTPVLLPFLAAVLIEIHPTLPVQGISTCDLHVSPSLHPEKVFKMASTLASKVPAFPHCFDYITASLHFQNQHYGDIINTFKAILNWAKKLKIALGKGRKSLTKCFHKPQKKLTAVQIGSEPAPIA